MEFASVTNAHRSISVCQTEVLYKHLF